MASATSLAPTPARHVQGLFAASLFAGMAHPFLPFVQGSVAEIVAKGLGVGLLALAAFALSSPARFWLAAIMAAGALGDVLLAVPGLFYVGAAAFALGHCVAIAFYARNRRLPAQAVQRFAALALLGGGLAMPMLVSPPGTPVGALMLYSVLLCGMTAALLLSRFARLAVVGALLFVLSDTLLIVRLGGTLVGDAALHGHLVWFSYYLGQALIFLGVAAGLPRTTAQ